MRGKTFCFAFSWNDGRVTFSQDRRNDPFKLRILSEFRCHYMSNKNFMISYYDFSAVRWVMRTYCRAEGTKRGAICAIGTIRIKTKWDAIFLTACM